MIAVLVVAGGGCQLQHALIRRASKEYHCPPANISVIARHDIQYDTFDVDVCGQRARYTCVGGGHAPYRCVHEPDPRQWDPDPVTVGTLNLPPGAFEELPFSTVRVLRICAPKETGCLFNAGGGWQWRPVERESCGGGFGPGWQ
jgi:hypothetical protein